MHKSVNAEVVVVSDGHFFLPTAFLLAPDAPPADRSAVLEATPPSDNRFRLPNNVAVIRSGSGVILVDAGAGRRHQPTSGKLVEHLKDAGIAPAAVVAVILTHGHPDHLWGVLGGDGKPVYPNARYLMSARERDLWLDSKATASLPPVLANDRIVKAARSHVAAIESRLEVVRDGEEIVSGVRVIESPGHTQGHISVELAGDDGFLIGADALTHPVISFSHPTWRVPVDHDPDRAVATRLRLLDRLARDKVRLLGAHLPVPGTGMVERRGTAYRFVPS